jgi:DNA-binding transcriptional ArsR family regulator
MLLRIHFTSEDLALTRLAEAPDAFWEVVLSAHLLRLRGAEPLLGPWKQALLEQLPIGSRLRAAIEPLIAINPAKGYFPDLLTPAESADGWEAGLEALLSLPQRRVRREIGRVGDEHGRLDSGTSDLAEGRAEAIKQLAAAVRSYHDTAVAPIAERIRAAFEADRALRAQAFLNGGIAAVLNGLHPNATFTGTVLELSDVHRDEDIRLDGRGLRLVPSYFKQTKTKLLTLADPELPQVLVYPINRSAGLTAAAARESLAALVGRTRAALLEQTASSGSTSELARRVAISPAAASQHLSVLREAGLVASTRDGNTVRHHLTPLGQAVLSGGA